LANDWRVELIEAHARLFHPPEGHPGGAQGYPNCEEGWSDLLERACVRIENALDTGDTFKIAEIKEKLGTLRFYWDGELSERAKAEVREAIALATARSACTCEICSAEGWLHNRGGWLATACAEHAKGQPVPVKPGFEHLHVMWGTADGQVRILSCRRYVRATDSFVDVPPDSPDIQEFL
jgi:hypothetical protein